jgi:hypothetical protein
MSSSTISGRWRTQGIVGNDKLSTKLSGELTNGKAAAMDIREKRLRESFLIRNRSKQVINGGASFNLRQALRRASFRSTKAEVPTLALYSQFASPNFSHI